MVIGLALIAAPATASADLVGGVSGTLGSVAFDPVGYVTATAENDAGKVWWLVPAGTSPGAYLPNGPITPGAANPVPAPPPPALHAATTHKARHCSSKRRHAHRCSRASRAQR